MGRGFADAHRAVLFHQLAVEGEHIAGCDLFAEAGIFDAAEGRACLILRQTPGAATAPVWASASRMRTPGMTGAPKWPLKNSSLPVHAFAANGPLAARSQDAVHEAKG